MNKGLLYKISRVYKLGKEFGLGGLSLAMKINSRKPGIIRGVLKNYRHPIFLRNESSDINVFGQVIYEKEYEFKYRVNPSVIVDCGANIGMATIFFKNKFPEATIISVEPEPSNFKLLQKNTEQYPNVHCLNYGIWNRSTHLKITNNTRGNWGFTVEEADKEANDTIQAISIDEIMKRYQLDHIDILKIDIEGSERKLFESNTGKWLPFVKVIVIEFHDATVKDCVKTFHKALEAYEYEIKTHGESVICYLK